MLELELNSPCRHRGSGRVLRPLRLGGARRRPPSWNGLWPPPRSGWSAALDGELIGFGRSCRLDAGQACGLRRARRLRAIEGSGSAGPRSCALLSAGRGPSRRGLGLLAVRRLPARGRRFLGWRGTVGPIPEVSPRRRPAPTWAESTQSAHRRRRADDHIPGHLYPRRRHRPGDHGGDEGGGGGDRRAHRVGGRRGRRRRHGQVRHAAARRGDRLRPRHQGGHQGPDHHARRLGLPQRERGPAQGARPLRQPAAGGEHPRGAVALRGRRPGDRAGEHRGPLRRRRAHGGHGRGRVHQDHHPAGSASASPASPSSTPAARGGARSRPSTRPTS